MTERPILFSAPMIATSDMIQAALDLVWEDSGAYGELTASMWRAMLSLAPDALRTILQSRIR